MAEVTGIMVKKKMTSRGRSEEVLAMGEKKSEQLRGSDVESVAFSVRENGARLLVL